jgi:hypothetical protein
MALHMQTNIHFWSYLAHLFLKWKMFQTTIVEKLETDFVFKNFFLQNLPFMK